MKIVHQEVMLYNNFTLIAKFTNDKFKDCNKLEQHKCGDKCIPKHFVNDNKYDCFDGSDESNFRTLIVLNFNSKISFSF